MSEPVDWKEYYYNLNKVVESQDAEIERLREECDLFRLFLTDITSGWRTGVLSLQEAISAIDAKL